MSKLVWFLGTMSAICLGNVLVATWNFVTAPSLSLGLDLSACVIVTALLVTLTANEYRRRKHDTDSTGVPVLDRAAMLLAWQRGLRAYLVAQRIRSGLSINEVARIVGSVPEDAYQFEQFEIYYTDPKLSEISRYALAVGATITGTVKP